MSVKLLAIETSSAACSAALSVDGVVEERYALAPRQHATLILPMIESLLTEGGFTAGQLDAIAFGCGPGSFTGVRIATSVAQAIAFGSSLPVVPVSSLAALALGAAQETGECNVLAALDARKSEVYWARYVCTESGAAELQGEEIVCLPESVPLPANGQWIGVGGGWASYGEVLMKHGQDIIVRLLPDAEPHARDIARLGVLGLSEGRSIDPEKAVPVYLRNNVADAKR